MVEKYTLKNGIPLFVVESHASPVVSIQAWVSRGSAYESNELAGISHFLEHALFKGTNRRQVGEIALEIESMGGEINAFTSFEETAYYTTLASRYFQDGLDVIADAIQNPSFDSQEMEREREVILEEIKRAHDSPYKMVATNLWKESFSDTPYGRPVLGFEHTVKKIDHRVLKQYFSRNYHAGSTSLFIVGDVDGKEVKQKADRMLARMKTGKRVPLPKNLRFPRINAPRIVAIERDVKECQLQLAVVAPPISHANIPAMDLACSALGQGESSRLYQRLVRDTQLALDISVGLVATGRCGLATIGMAVAPENLEAALQECSHVLGDVLARGLNESETERVKSSLEADVVFGKETVDGYARRLGYYYIQFGDPNYESKYLEKVMATGHDEASDAFRTLFAQKPVLSIVHPNIKALNKKSLGKAIQWKLTKVTAKTPEVTGPERVKSEGVSIIAKRIHTLPVVALRMLFPGGTREESKSQYGIAGLLQRVWTSGTRSYSAMQIAHTLESIGASVHGFSGKNSMGLHVEFLTKHWPIVKPILSEVLLEPTFPEEEFQMEKNILLRDILSERDTPGQICHLNFMASLFPGHHYGRSSLGTKDTVSAFTRDSVVQFYRDYIQRSRLVVSTVGAFPEGQWLKELEALISRLPESGKPARSAGEVQLPDRSDLKINFEKKQPLFQTHVMAGFFGASSTDPDRFALKVLSSALAGQGGRLFLELRDKQSLAYSVSPMSTDSPDRGLFAFYIGCSPEKLERSLSGIRGEIDKLIETKMGNKELDRAKEFWIGRFELEMQKFASQAMLFGLDELYGLGYDHSAKVPQIVKALTADDIRRASEKFLKPDSAVISIVHNADVDESTLRKAWSGR